MNKLNVTAQLLYELQGEMYLHPDVVADIRTVRISETKMPNRVQITAVKGSPPPPTTKVMIAAPGGYQAEATYYINGLDVAEKAAMLKRQLENIFQDSNFSKFSADVYGTQAPNPSSQASGTVILRVFAQAREMKDISVLKFKTPIYSLRMQSYPGQFLEPPSLDRSLVSYINRIPYESRLSYHGAEAVYGDISIYDPSSSN